MHPVSRLLTATALFSSSLVLADSFLCPSAETIQFNAKTHKWEAPLTKGMPSHWHKLVSHNEMAPEEEPAAANPFKFTSAHFLITNPKEPVERFNHQFHCQYESMVQPDRIIVLAPDSPALVNPIVNESLDMDYRTDLPFWFEGDHWKTVEEHLPEKQEYSGLFGWFWNYVDDAQRRVAVHNVKKNLVELYPSLRAFHSCSPESSDPEQCPLRMAQVYIMQNLSSIFSYRENQLVDYLHLYQYHLDGLIINGSEISTFSDHIYNPTYLFTGLENATSVQASDHTRLLITGADESEITLPKEPGFEKLTCGLDYHGFNTKCPEEVPGVERATCLDNIRTFIDPNYYTLIAPYPTIDHDKQQATRFKCLIYRTAKTGAMSEKPGLF